MEDIKVSVIMPMMNVRPYIRECMDSVVNQTLKDLEIICVDAYSTDGSREIVLEYAENDHRIKLIDDDKGSTGYSNNMGIRMASGRYIAILETDDYIEPSMYETLYSIGEKEQCDIVRADYKVFWGEREERIFLDKPIVCERSMYDGVVSAREDKKLFLNDMSTWAGIYRRDFLLENQIWHNETPGAAYQDNGFWFQALATAGKIRYVPVSGYRYRLDNPNSSIRNPKKTYAICDEYEFIRTCLERKGIFEEFCPVFVYIKYVRYMSSFHRLHAELKLQFLDRFREEMQEHLKRDEINWELFSEVQRENLEKILASPQEFYENLLRREQELMNFIQEQEKVAQFGCGSDGIRFLSYMKEHGRIRDIECVMDNNQKLQGTEIFGIPVVSPQKAEREYRRYGYVVTSLNHASAIKKQLRGMGIPEDKIRVCDIC